MPKKKDVLSSRDFIVEINPDFVVGFKLAVGELSVLPFASSTGIDSLLKVKEALNKILSFEDKIQSEKDKEKGRYWPDAGVFSNAKIALEHIDKAISKLPTNSDCINRQKAEKSLEEAEKIANGVS